MLDMGAWGQGLWSDDTAADVRSTYREALEDGLDDAAAAGTVLTAFKEALDDADDGPVVWLALAAAQSNVGRLTENAKTKAIEVIDSGADLRRWDTADAKTTAKRRTVLAKLRDQLTGDQPAAKRIRRPSRPVTSLTPGDLLAYRAESGRLHLLAVRALHETRYFIAPAVQLLDFDGTELPDPKKLAHLQVRHEGRHGRGPDRPAEPWWTVDGHVLHRRGHDYADEGFDLVAHLDPLLESEQRAIDATITSSSNWTFWASYLQKQDELLGERIGANRRGLFHRRS